MSASVPLMVRPMSDRLDDYDFPLPDQLIAQRPAARREDARMMVLDRREGRIAHRRFADLPDFVRPGELLVLNNTRVLPARRFSDDGKIEFLFLEQARAADLEMSCQTGAQNADRCNDRPRRHRRPGGGNL